MLLWFSPCAAQLTTEFLNELIKTAILLLASRSREVIKSVLGFIKVHEAGEPR
jgi:hypothetical protein